MLVSKAVSYSDIHSRPPVGFHCLRILLQTMRQSMTSSTDEVIIFAADYLEN